MFFLFCKWLINNKLHEAKKRTLFMKEYTIVWRVNEYLSNKSLCAHPV